jgi:uncharacterized Zn finger protein
MEALARESGDVEAQVAITSRDLTSPRSFLEIAEFYREAGRAADALAWAEQGMAAFPTGEDPGLTTFVVDAYLDGGRNREAMELAWEGFARHPGFAAFHQLKARADRAGQWDQWRARARTLLRQQATPMTQTTYREARWARGYSELVEALLWDEEPDIAWREAVAGGCTDEVWLQLAAIREQEHPEDVIPVYRRLAERLVQEKNNDAYRRAAAIVKRLGGVMVGLGRGEEFLRLSCFAPEGSPAKAQLHGGPLRRRAVSHRAAGRLRGVQAEPVESNPAEFGEDRGCAVGQSGRREVSCSPMTGQSFGRRTALRRCGGCWFAEAGNARRTTLKP